MNKIYQFRREKAWVGSPHIAFFCEIEASSKKEALKIVKTTPTDKLPWREIDRYDRSKEEYDEVSFECLLE